MQRTWERQTEQTLQVALTRSRAQQIIHADDVSNAIGSIVNNDRKVIGPGAIGTTHDKIANFAGNILFNPASGTVSEHLRPGCDPHTPG
jgi:cobalamin biosynthesis protein CbiG